MFTLLEMNAYEIIQNFKHAVKVNISVFDTQPGMHCFTWLPSLLQHFINFLTIPQWKNLIAIQSNVYWLNKKTLFKKLDDYIMQNK